MKLFSLPSDFKKETIDKYFELNQKYPDSKVIETYGNITKENIFGSGRPVGAVHIGIDELKDYVKYCAERNIDFNYTLNAPSMKNLEFTKAGIKKIKDFIIRLSDIGIKNITVSVPAMIEIINSLNIGIKIKVSTISQINNVYKAMEFKKYGVNRIVVEESINRDFFTLKSILDNFGEDMEIIINVICHKNCIYRPFHYNQDIIDSVEKVSEYDYYIMRCVQRMINDPVNLLKNSWVRPEDLKYYENIGIKYFKLQGRQAVMTGDPARTVECYINGSFDGDLMMLLWMFSKDYFPTIKMENKKLEGFIEPFLNNKYFCQNNCDKCNYCKSFANRCLVMEGLKSYQDYINSHNFDKYTDILNISSK
jgi:collagenase-like PrtC family protease